jgi:Kdo2-lipid IVA lauroyltransferase/acyltransferase
MKHRPKHLLEYAALRALAPLIRILPYRGALLLGWLAARVVFAVFRYRVSEAQTRIGRVFGSRFSPPEIRRIAWQSWRNFVFNAVELLRVSKMTRAWICGVFDGRDAIRGVKAHLESGRGGIIASPHMGNWETAAVYCLWNGIPIFHIAAAQKNPLTNQYLDHLRALPGIESISRGAGTLKRVIRRLKQGHVLAILPDVRMPAEGVMVPFLGGEANVARGMALFARQTNVPIFTFIITRRGWARQKIELQPIIWPDLSLDKEQDIARMTSTVMKSVDKAIHEDPGQWFWFNKRWILDPVEPPEDEEPPDRVRS